MNTFTKPNGDLIIEIPIPGKTSEEVLVLIGDDDISVEIKPKEGGCGESLTQSQEHLIFNNFSDPSLKLNDMEAICENGLLVIRIPSERDENIRPSTSDPWSEIMRRRKNPSDGLVSISGCNMVDIQSRSILSVLEIHTNNYADFRGLLPVHHNGRTPKK